MEDTRLVQILWGQLLRTYKTGMKNQEQDNDTAACVGNVCGRISRSAIGTHRAINSSSSFGMTRFIILVSEGSPKIGTYKITERSTECVHDTGIHKQIQLANI